MPSNWLAMDDNFPTFTGNESPTQQINALHNYLYQLREGLLYSMQNLTAENFNEAALQKLTQEQKDALALELKKLQAMINNLSNEVAGLSGRVSGVEGLGYRVQAAEEEITYLQGDVQGQEARIVSLEEDVGVLEMDRQEVRTELLLTQQEAQAATEKASIIEIGEDGSATLGAEGQVLRLVGTIYINGQLIESGGEAT